MRITKKGALSVTREFDRIASFIQEEAKNLNIPPRIATMYAKMSDQISDHIERQAGLKRDRDGRFLIAVDQDQFDPSDIGREDAGPLQQDSDEDYMRGQFTMQERRELREEQEAGRLPGVSLDEQRPQAGVQVSFARLANVVANSNPSTQAHVAHVLDLAFRSLAKVAQDEDGDKDEMDEDEKEAGKKKAHGFNLYL